MFATKSGLLLLTALCVIGTVRSQITEEPLPVLNEENRPCGGVLNEARGYLQTPGFPDKFQVPIKCKWVIDASLQPFNSSIVVYLTQLFVTTGLKFTESLFYDPELSYSLGEKFGENLLHSVTEKNCRSTSWLKSDAKFLIVDFELDQLEGNHLRSLDGLLDVYGFNITYEARSDSSDPVREPTCSVVDCSYEGHCYAADNFTEYYCDCFPGFEGNDCSQGPLCSIENNICMNNSTCRHLGATTAYCSCPSGYKGSRCDVVSSNIQILPDCKISTTESCMPQCSYKLNQAPCTCPQGFSKAPTDRMRYQNTIKLGASSGSRSDLPKIHPNRTFTAQFERQVFKYLRNKIPKIDGLRVINLTLEGEVTFHFFANKRDGRKVKDALNELVEKRHLGNITFAPNKILLRQNPTLLIKEVHVNQKKPAVRCGDDFILSCTALGSPHISFRWFKDGMIVNETIALRSIWTKQMKTNVNDQYTSLLGVKSADALDEGSYTCQVTDWGVEQCKTIDIEVIPPPDVKVIPMTVTVEKGSNLNIVCMWPVGVDDRGQIYGYSWLKETKDSKEVNLFKMQKDVEEWEDLYPAGSILKVFSIQKSTKYTCQVQSNVGSVNASIDVEILNKTAVPWCEADNSNSYKMHWTETRVWGIAKVECPPHYKGIAKRMCSLIYTGEARWQTPDFSECTSNRLIKISNQLQSLMLGFQNTTTVEILANVLELLKVRTELYPGEGEPVLSLMQNITWYLNVTSAWTDLVEATPLFYSIVNTLLQFDNAIINSQKVVDLQKMVNQWTIFWTSHIEPEFNPTLIFESLIVDVFTFDSSSVQSGIIFYLPRNTHISYPSWFKESLAVIINSGNRMLDNGTVCVAVVVYRDIMKYLPVRQVFKKEDGSELEYEVASNVISFVSNAVLKTMVEIEFATLTRRGWNMTCGVMMTPWTRWQLEMCYVNSMSGRNVTQCSCKMLATFTALIMKTTVKNETRSHPMQTNVVLIGCLSCMVQSILTLALLFVRWYYSPSYLIFLKIQCCTAISASMIVFLSATSTNLNKSSYPFAAISLEAFLLLAMSSHLSKLLLVYAEVVSLTKIKSIKLTVISIMNGFTMLIMLCNYLVHNSSDWEMESWWLIKGTFIFYSCLTSGFLMAALFIFIYVCVMKHLALLLTIKSVQADSSKAIQRRLGLLRRAGLIFVSIYVMVAASIFYVNYPGHMSAQYAFSFTCVLLGFVLLSCYIIQSETSYHLYLIKKVGTDLAYMTGSDGNILSFFTKQDGEVESEAAPPSKDSYSCEDEAVQLKDMCSSNTMSSKTDISHKSGKMVTFYSDLVSDCAKDDRQCNWESCSKNGQTFECSTSNKVECTEEPMMVDKWHFMRASYCQNTPECSKSNQSGPEMVTTRVCVELGVIKNGDRGDNMMETPTIVLCSVDVEPCPGNVVELNEIMVKTISDTTHPSPDLLNHETVKFTTSAESSSTPSLPDNIPSSDAKKVVDPTKSKESAVDSQVPSVIDDSDVLDRITQDLDYLLNRNSESNPDVIENKLTLSRLPLTHIPEEDNELESTMDKNLDTEL